MNVNDLIEGFDQVRRNFEPTNGECIAVFTSLVSDCISEAPEEARSEIARRVVHWIVSCVDSDRAVHEYARRRLLTTCKVTLEDEPIPQRPGADEWGLGDDRAQRRRKGRVNGVATDRVGA